MFNLGVDYQAIIQDHDFGQSVHMILLPGRFKFFCVVGYSYVQFVGVLQQSRDWLCNDLQCVWVEWNANSYSALLMH